MCVEQSCEDAVSAHEKGMPSEKLEPISDFQVGDRVLVQDMHTKSWSLHGQIRGHLEGNHSFVVLIDGKSARFTCNVQAGMSKCISNVNCRLLLFCFILCVYINHLIVWLVPFQNGFVCQILR